MRWTVEQLRTLEEQGNLVWDIKHKSNLSCYDVFDAIHTGNILSTSTFLWSDKCFLVGTDWDGNKIHLQLCVNDKVWVQSAYYPYQPAIHNSSRERKEKSMQCFYCKTPTEPGKTTRFKEFEKTHLILKEVPCDVCPQCGEAFIDSTIMKEVERIQDKYSKSKSIVNLVSYEAQTAKPTLDALEQAEKERAAKEMRAAAAGQL